MASTGVVRTAHTPIPTTKKVASSTSKRLWTDHSMMRFSM